MLEPQINEFPVTDEDIHHLVKEKNYVSISSSPDSIMKKDICSTFEVSVPIESIQGWGLQKNGEIKGMFNTM